MTSDRDVKDCPFCGKQVDEKAEKCPFCERIFRLDFSPQKTPAEKKKVLYIAAVFAVFLAAFLLIIFIFSVSNNESVKLSSGKIKTTPSKEVFPNQTIQNQKTPAIQTPNTSSGNNKESKSIAEKKKTPLKKPSSSKDKKITKPEKAPAKPLPKPKQDNSDFYTLG